MHSTSAETLQSASSRGTSADDTIKHPDRTFTLMTFISRVQVWKSCMHRAAFGDQFGF